MVGKVLKGARSRDLPIERPNRFVLVVNMKTAKTLGITILLIEPVRAAVDRIPANPAALPRSRSIRPWSCAPAASSWALASSPTAAARRVI